MPAESLEEFVPEQDDEAAYTAVIAPPPPRTLLMGSALAFVVMSFATLAVTVAVDIRPVADVEAQPVPPSSRIPCRGVTCLRCRTRRIRWRCRSRWCRRPPAAPALPNVPTIRVR